jgi:hypothetical protein
MLRCDVAPKSKTSSGRKQVVFSSIPAEADRQTEQLRNVLHDLGATKTTPVTILSGAPGRDKYH